MLQSLAKRPTHGLPGRNSQTHGAGKDAEIINGNGG